MEAPTRLGLNTGNGWGLQGKISLSREGGAPPGSSDPAWEGGHSGGPADTMGRPANPGRCPAPRARAPQAHVALDYPVLPTILQTAQISEPPARRCTHPGGRLQVPIRPKCIKPGVCLNGRRPRGPPVDKQHSLGGVGGSQPAPSTHRARPSG